MEDLYSLEMGLYDDTLNPDLLLPSQFYGNIVKGVSYTPEHRLAAAILTDAINCYLSKSDHESARAWQWFCQDDIVHRSPRSRTPRIEHVFSFRNICDLLEIEPVGMWKSLMQARKEIKKGRRIKRIDHDSVVY